MGKKIIIAGIVAGVAMSLWLFVVNGIFGFGSSITMKSIPEEREVYELLRSAIVEPGRYVVNPTVDPVPGFPVDQPVFSISYGGVGHEAAGMLMVISLLTVFGSTLLVAWLLSLTATRARATYVKRVLFFSAAGMLMALSVDLASFGIGGYPLQDALLLGFHRVAMWAFAGAAAAWFMRPEPVADEERA